MSMRSSIPKMLSQSRDVLTSPSAATFERYEKDGTLIDALIYIALAAVVTGIFGFTAGPGGFIRNLIATLIGFLVFTYIVHWLGTRRGGTGTLDEVAYSFALFWAPLSVIFGLLTFLLVISIVGVFLVPLVAIAALILNIYFAYLAVQSSLNLSPGGPTWTVLILAALVSFLINFLVALLFGSGGGTV